MVKMGREAQHILPKNWGVKVFNREIIASLRVGSATDIEQMMVYNGWMVSISKRRSKQKIGQKK